MTGSLFTGGMQGAITPWGGRRETCNKKATPCFAAKGLEKLDTRAFFSPVLGLKLCPNRKPGLDLCTLVTWQPKRSEDAKSKPFRLPCHQNPQEAKSSFCIALLSLSEYLLDASLDDAVLPM